MISSILQREFMSVSSTMNIAWTVCEHPVFRKFIETTCKPCNIIDLDQTYYGLNDVSLIICNNRLTHIDKSIALAKFLLCPLLIIDHSEKSSIVNNVITNIPIEPVYQIATTKNIYISWNKIQNSIMEYDVNNNTHRKIWKNLIFQLCKSNMVIKDEQIIQANKA